MIKVTVELWPFGSEEHKKTIGEMKIWNDGSGSPWLGSYGFDIKDGPKGILGEFQRQTGSIWCLLEACLKIAFPNPEWSFRDGEIIGRIKELSEETKV